MIFALIKGKGIALITSISLSSCTSVVQKSLHLYH